MKKSILVGCIFVAIIAGITIGIIVHVFNDTNLEKATLEEVENANKMIEKEVNIIQTGTSEEKTTPNTKIVYETFYTNCNHMENVIEDIENEDVNQNKDYFINKYLDWKVNNFSEDTVELYKEIEGICDKHYIVKEKDGYIAVYNLDSENNQNLKEVTEIYVQYLPEEDVELLKNGINVIGDNDLARVLADFE